MNEEVKVTKLKKVLLVDIQEIDQPICRELRRWKQEMAPHIVALEKTTEGTDIQPVMISTHFEEFRAYRFGVKGYDEPIYVKGPIPEIFERLVNGLLAAQTKIIQQLRDEIRELDYQLEHSGDVRLAEDAKWRKVRKGKQNP